MRKGAPSTNPSGRPPAANEFRVKARALVDELVLKAWEAEVRSMGDNWLKASELLAAYGYGKPSQTIDLVAEVTTSDKTPLTGAQRLAYLAERKAEREKTLASVNATQLQESPAIK